METVATFFTNGRVVPKTSVLPIHRGKGAPSRAFSLVPCSREEACFGRFQNSAAAARPFKFASSILQSVAGYGLSPMRSSWYAEMEDVGLLPA